jgi:hypothetical protein
VKRGARWLADQARQDIAVSATRRCKPTEISTGIGRTRLPRLLLKRLLKKMPA